MLSFLLAAVVTCQGVNDTAAIQAAVDTDATVTLEGVCVVSGQPGVRIPSNRTINAYGAVVTQTPNIGGSGTAGRNRAFETISGAENVKFYGGRLVGSRDYVGGLQWSIGLRIDSATNVLVQDTVFEDWYTDGVWIGGNPPGSYNVTLRNIRIANSKRNALSITCGSMIRIESSIFETTNCTEGGTVTCNAVELNMPRCGVDVEPNPGDIVNDLRVTDSISRNNERCGWFVQSGMGGAGSTYVFDRVRAEGNGTHGLIINQVSKATVTNSYVSGGTIGYSFGAGLMDLTFLDSEVIGTSGNGINYAGVWNPTVRRVKVNGRPVAIIAIVSPVAMNGVAGDVDIKPYQ